MTRQPFRGDWRCPEPDGPLPEPDYYAFALTSTAAGQGMWEGQVILSFAPSPFVFAVSPEGDYVYQVHVAVRGLPALSAGGYMVWAASPDLSRVTRVGVLDANLSVTGEVEINKFLLFVTREQTLDAEHWTGPILLRGISRSGLMHSMRGHGAFNIENC